MNNPESDRLRRIEELARKREHAEEAWADAETAYNESHEPAQTRRMLGLDRLETERAVAIADLRAALATTRCRRRSGDPEARECGYLRGHAGPHHPRAMVTPAEQEREALRLEALALHERYLNGELGPSEYERLLADLGKQPDDLTRAGT